MLNIKEGNPWVFWPSSICDTFPDNPGNKILHGDSSFTMTVDLSFKDTKGGLICILPHYTALEVDKKQLKFSLTYNSNKLVVKYLDYKVKNHNRCKIIFEHLKDEYFKLFVNKVNYLTLDLTKDKFKVENDPHIIFGANNFPQNKLNLLYNNINLYEFKLQQGNEVLSHHKFKKFIYNKSYDLSNNLNFIHKI